MLPLFLLGEGAFLIISSTHMEMSLDFLSIHQLAGGGSPEGCWLGKEERGREGREPGKIENSVFTQQSKDGALSAPHRLLTLCTKPAPLLKEKLLASAYRLRGAVSTLASLSS